MTEQFGAIKETQPIKQQLEAVAEAIWTGRDFEDRIDGMSNPWALYDLASKTFFQDTVEIERALQNNGLCESCSITCLELVRQRQHMPSGVFKSDVHCLLDWKKDMREDHDYSEVDTQQLDYSLTILKPGHDTRSEGVLISTIGRDAIIDVKEVTLTEDAIAFLYTTAYGKDFIEEMTNYMTSGPVRIVLFNRQNIGQELNRTKKIIRAQLNTASPMQNNIHMPDSFHEALAQIAYFFPEHRQLLMRELHD